MRIVYNAAEVKADLYATIPGTNEINLLLGVTTKGDALPTVWQYIATDSSTDNFTGGVIQPTLQTGNGRWIRQDNCNYPIIPKRQETYSGITDASGNYTITFGTAYSVIPNIQANIVGGTSLQRSTISAISTTGFTINVVSQNTNNLLGIISLLSSTTVVNGAAIDVVITEK